MKRQRARRTSSSLCRPGAPRPLTTRLPMQNASLHPVPPALQSAIGPSRPAQWDGRGVTGFVRKQQPTTAGSASTGGCFAPTPAVWPTAPTLAALLLDARVSLANGGADRPGEQRQSAASPRQTGNRCRAGPPLYRSRREAAVASWTNDSSAVPLLRARGLRSWNLSRGAAPLTRACC